jgi:hypothetical protein
VVLLIVEGYISVQPTKARLSMCQIRVEVVEMEPTFALLNAIVSRGSGRIYTKKPEPVPELSLGRGRAKWAVYEKTTTVLRRSQFHACRCGKTRTRKQMATWSEEE